jgi:hypothetical protein
MPYGLKNAPAVFQSFANEILRDLHGQGVVAYIDDILIYSIFHIFRYMRRAYVSGAQSTCATVGA